MTTQTAKIITVFNQKGGVGKTTTACQLAGSLGHMGFDVLLADLDDQRTSTSWAGNMEGRNFPSTVWNGYMYQSSTAAELAKFAPKYEVIVIDCRPGINEKGTWASLLVSDLAIIPTMLSPQASSALPAAKQLAKEAWRTIGKRYPARVLTVAVPPKSRINALERAEHELLEEDKEIPLMRSALSRAAAITGSMAYGATVHSMPNARVAIEEVDSLTKEVLGLLGLKANSANRKGA
jgi:chromosome partitioning protein